MCYTRVNKGGRRCERMAAPFMSVSRAVLRKSRARSARNALFVSVLCRLQNAPEL